jgi:hypothetical protein
MQPPPPLDHVDAGDFRGGGAHKRVVVVMGVVVVYSWLLWGRFMTEGQNHVCAWQR